MEDSGERLIIVMLADIPEDGISAFQQYESLVLPILDEHGGRLERRFRTPDGRVEVHIVSFDDRAGLDSYMADPDRTTHRELLAGVDVRQRALEVHEVRDR
jgi:hypothetical protein